MPLTSPLMPVPTYLSWFIQIFRCRLPVLSTTEKKPKFLTPGFFTIQTRMTHSRAHNSAKAANFAKLLVLNKHQVRHSVQGMT